VFGALVRAPARTSDPVRSSHKPVRHTPDSFRPMCLRFLCCRALSREPLSARGRYGRRVLSVAASSFDVNEPVFANGVVFKGAQIEGRPDAE
jgi:hypothetical protein